MAESTAQINQSLIQAYLKRYPDEFTRQMEKMSLRDIAGELAEMKADSMVTLFERMSPGFCTEILKGIDRKTAVRIFNFISPNRGAAILRSLDQAYRDQLLSELNPAARRDLNTALDYPPDSAGSLMGTRLVFFTPDMTVAEAVKKLATHGNPRLRVIYLVDEQQKLNGMLHIFNLVLAGRETLLKDLSEPVRVQVDTMTPKERLVEIFESNRITELPVVDITNKLTGIVRHYILVNAAREENSADIQTMVGASKDERALSAASFAIRKRLPWLHINLATAFLAAVVVGLFEATIAQVTALAVLLPVVAGQSGNTGAQALAVTMRGLALHEIWPRQWLLLLFKELKVGFWNGVAVGITTALGVYIWSQSPGLCLIIGVSMVISMIIASIAGAMVPILLVKTGQDPATSSSIFLTTVTDVMGFFSFLGIATLLLNMI